MRISRLFGLVRFLRLQKTVDRLTGSIRTLIYNIEYVLITMVVFVLSTGFILWQVETRFDGSMTSLPDALWWALATVTTMRYGELMPSSPEGKVLGIVMSLLGTILLIVFIARVTASFLSPEGAKMTKRKQK
jgi:voltage-gated potassium channel